MTTPDMQPLPEMPVIGGFNIMHEGRLMTVHSTVVVLAHMQDYAPTTRLEVCDACRMD